MIRPLNVLHVTSNLAGGGVQRLLVKSLAVMDRTRFVHRVCCVSAGGVYEDELRSLGIPCWIMRRRARCDPTVIFQMARLMRRKNIDIVHTLNFTANAWGRIAARLAGVSRVIAHERGTAWTEGPVMRRVDRLLYPWTDVLLANSEAAKIVLTQCVKLPADRIRIVYNGVPRPERTLGSVSKLRDRLGIGTDVPLVVAVSRMDTPKGHIFLLRAIPYVWQSVPEAHFALIGDGPLRGYLEVEAQRLGLLSTGSVHFTGFLLNAPDLIQEADLLVHPAVREPLGNILIEAGLARLPVVASNVDGCPEVVVDGRTGVLVDCTQSVQYVAAPGASSLPAVVVDGRTRTLRPPLGPSPEDLAAAMVSLLRNPRLRRQMGERAQERAERLFGLDRYVRDLQSVYRGEG